MFRRSDAVRAHRVRTALGSLLAFVVALALGGAGLAGADTERPIALVGAHIIDGTGNDWPTGTLLMHKGLIVAVGPEVKLPAGTRIIDGAGLVCLPGFIEPFATLGVPVSLVDPAERARREGTPPATGETAPAHMDEARREGLMPDRRAADALDLSEAAGEAYRKAGFTVIATAPQAGYLKGQAAIVSLSGRPRRRALLAGMPTVVASLSHREAGYPGTVMGTMAYFRQLFLDAERYAQHWKLYRENPQGIARPPLDPVLRATAAMLDGRIRVLFQANKATDIQRVLDLKEEFGLNLAIGGGREAADCVERLKALKVPVVLALTFGPDPAPAPEKTPATPKAAGGTGAPRTAAGAGPDTTDEATDATPADKPAPLLPKRVLDDLRRRWLKRARTARTLLDAGIPVIFSTRGLADPGRVWEQVRALRRHGISRQASLAALTSGPARWLGIDAQLGTLAPGKIASAIAYAPDAKTHGVKVRHVFIDDRYFEYNRPKPGDTPPPPPTTGTPAPQTAPGTQTTPGAPVPADARGIRTYRIEVKLRWRTLKGIMRLQELEGGAVAGTIEAKGGEGFVAGTFKGGVKLHASVGLGGWSMDIELRAKSAGKKIAGTFTAGDSSGSWSAEALPAGLADPPVAIDAERLELEADRKPKTRTGGSVLIRKATIMTLDEAGTFTGDILILGGRIAKLGPDLEAPAGVTTIDASGRYVTPGMIDCHSHIAIEGGVNEMNATITAECRIGDSVNPKDLNIYRALAGGTTVANLFHGSANPIGGQNQVIKLRWGKPARALKFRGAPPGIKFALGENVIRNQKRFPNTRMGVETAIRRAFVEARAYLRRWDAYTQATEAGKRRVPPRRDLRLAALAQVIEGARFVHCHSYRADEILMLMRLAEDFHFRVRTFQHALEAYKVAPEIAKHGAGISTFSDWWAYKIEAYDAIPMNAAICQDAGVLSTINSDSSDLIRRLNLEAAKVLKYARRMTPEDALKTASLNAAKQLGIERRVGSLAVGKDGDLVIWNGHPLSSRTRCLMTLIDGEVYFERRAASEKRFANRADPVFRIPKTRRVPLAIPAGKPIYVLANATLHTMDARGTIARGQLVIAGGKIRYAGAGPLPAPPAGAVVIDANGLHVWPGMLNATTVSGLTEIGSAEETRDTRDLGTYQPEQRAFAAYNPNSRHVAVTRANGITATLVMPAGGSAIAGRAAIMRTAGHTREEAVLVAESGLVIALPASGGPAMLAEDAKYRALLQYLDDARAWLARQEAARATGTPPPPENTRYVALAPYLRRERPVYVRANSVGAIRSALAFAKQQKLDLVLFGALNGWKIAAELAAAKVPVILDGVHRVPGDPTAAADENYASAALLAQAGVSFGFGTGGSSNARNLPYLAARAVAYGLDPKVARRALTATNARILGLGERLGRLAPGLDADLIVTDGDLLEITTHTLAMFVGGVPTSLENDQTRLEREFRRRLKR